MNAAPPVAEARTLLEHVEEWPTLRVRPRGDHVSLRAPPDDHEIATLDLRTGVLEVEVPADDVVDCVRVRPRLRGAPGGLAVEVVDAEGLAVAEWLLRRRGMVERHAAQYRNASP
jgi:hypothetical protein